MRVSIIAITSFLALGNSGVQALAIPSNQALASDAQSQVDQAVAPLGKSAQISVSIVVPESDFKS